MIRHIINGEVVLQYEQPQLDPNEAAAKKLLVDGKLLISEGYIALQAKSHPFEFRNIELMRLEEN